ncbi:DNA-3-methyladenine glycosylase 2 family protein [Candidatus Gottesmanbacteria bacterium]|nr:DNA-3-methyladenine glycosylase 2 family protein [Candidatus Gottesmanbacteria bacterium]
MTRAVKKHFQTVDPILASVIPRIAPIAVGQSNDYFSDLIEAIINQQLSDKAAATIFGRFKTLFPKGKITPEKLLTMQDGHIRAVGTSWSKISYMKNIAQAWLDGTITFDTYSTMTDEAIIEQLTKVKGVGVWTAEMFLMFTLGREDVFSYGDLGLRRAIQKLYKFKREPTIKQMEKIVTKWKPYRTYAARILWKSLELS